MAKTNAIRETQRMLFSPEEMGMKGARETKGGIKDAAKLPTIGEYLKTRDGLWRLLALCDGGMTVVEAVRQFPTLLYKEQKGGAL